MESSKIQNRFSVREIVSFVTGRLYSQEPLTTHLAELGRYLLWVDNSQVNRYPSTCELPGLQKEFKACVAGACPEPLQKILENWQHTDDWEMRIESLQHEFGDIPFGV